MAAPTYVQSNGTYTGSASTPATIAQAYSSNNTAGNTLVCFVGASGTGAGTWTIADTLGNTWVALPFQTTGGNASQGWYCLSCKSTGANTVTVTINPASTFSFQGITVGEWSGVTSALQAFSNASANAVGNVGIQPFSIDRPSLTVGMSNGPGGTYTTPTNWTGRQNLGRMMLCERTFTLSSTLGSYTFNGTPGTTGAAIVLVGSDSPFNSNYIQSAENYVNASSTTNTSLSYASNNTLGNTLVVLFSDTSGTAFSISDTLGNTWASLTLQTSGTSVSKVFYCVSCKAGANTITGTFTGSAGFQSISIFEFSSMSSLDVSNQAVAATVNATTTHTDLLVGCGDGANASSFATSTGFTNPVNPMTDATAQVRSTVQFKSSVASGSQTFAVTGVTEINLLAFIPNSGGTVSTIASGSILWLNRYMSGLSQI